MKQLGDIAFYVWCAAQLAAFGSCWLLWRSRESWKKAAQKHKPPRPLRAKTVVAPMFHAPIVTDVTDEDLIE